MIVSRVQQEDIVILQHFMYVWHVPLGKNQTQLKLVVYPVKTENIVIPKVGMYVQHVLLDMN
jgi:hypothetical protein